MNNHYLITVIDTFDHIVYDISLVNPEKEEIDLLYKEACELPGDICVWSPIRFQHEAKDYKELQEAVPYFSNHVGISIHDLMQRVI